MTHGFGDQKILNTGGRGEERRLERRPAFVPDPKGGGPWAAVSRGQTSNLHPTVSQSVLQNTEWPQASSGTSELRRSEPVIRVVGGGWKRRRKREN